MSSYAQSQTTSQSQQSEQCTTVEQEVLAPEAAGLPRTVAGSGGYIYEQYPTGTLVIVDGPTGVGTRLTEGAAWEAITAEIGPYPAVDSTEECETPTLDAAGEELGEDGDADVLDDLAVLAGQVGKSFGEFVAELAQAADDLEDWVTSWWEDEEETSDESADAQVEGAPAADVAEDGESAEQIDDDLSTEEDDADLESSGEIPPLTQFTWYGWGGKELGFAEAATTMKAITEAFSLGTHMGSVTTEASAAGGLDANSGYYWFNDTDQPVFNQGCGGVKYVLNPLDWSDKINEVTGYLAAAPPGERATYMKMGGGHVFFGSEEQDGWTAVPSEILELDAINVPHAWGCYAATDAMLAQQGTDHVAWPDEAAMRTVTDEEMANGEFSVTMDPDVSQKAKAYLDFELASGRGVKTGVTHQVGSANPDEITDHWIVTDAIVSDNEYSFLDPAMVSTAEVERDSNTLSWDGSMLSGTGWKDYVVSWILPNTSSLEAWSAHWATLNPETETDVP